MRIKQADEKRGRIEIIPMIDVVFFLLVFSMLTSLAMATIGAPPVNVPEVTTSEKGSQTRVFVTLTRDKSLFVNDKQIKATELTAKLQEKIEQNPELTVIVNCDKSNNWGEFRAIMAATYAADPKYIAIMTKARQMPASTGS